MNQDKNIRKITNELLQKMGWGSVEQWNTKDFEKLSDEILTATNTYLSVTTLKRLLGKVKYNSSPNDTTLDTIAYYLGYENWRSYNQARSLPETDSKGISFKSILAGISFLLFLCATIFVLISNHSSKEEINPKDVSFTIEKVTKGIPNTVIFNYDVSKVSAKKVEIQQDWDLTKRHVVSSENNFFSHFYEFPGYYNAKLVIDDQVIKTLDLYIPSDGWMAALTFPDRKPRYLITHEFSKNEELSATESIIKEIVSSGNEVVLHYINALENPSADFSDFEINTEFSFDKVSGEYICEYRRLIILGTKMSLRIPFMVKGCVGNLEMRLGKEFIKAEHFDLRALGLTSNERIKVRVLNKQNTLSIFINNQFAFSRKLHDDYGNIAGVHFAFQGAGKVHAIQLKASGNDLINY